MNENAGALQFMVCLAGVTIGIKTPYAEIKDLMKEYVVNTGTPSFDVEISEEKRAETLRRLRHSNGDDFICSPAYLEFIAIHSVVSDRLLDYDVLTMHGSCLEYHGDGYIFTAPSGTGKSTHSRLWREAYGNQVKMVNDDKPMLICREDEIIACGTPWYGKEMLGENTSVRLKAIAFLERAEKNRVTSISPDELFEKLYIQTYHSPTKEPAKIRKSMELLSRICRNVPMYRLEVNMNPDAAIVSCEGMSN